MKYYIIAFLVFLSTLSVAQEQKMRIMRGDSKSGTVQEVTDESIFSVPELSAMIVQDGDKLLVDHIMEEQMRMKGYEKTDLQEGDLILMASGKKVTSLKELKELYKSASTGSTVKFGVKRKDEMMIASFVKADPKDIPHVRMMFSTGGDEEMVGIPQIGLLIGNKGKVVVIKNVLPNASKDLPNVDVKEGDIITTVNGSSIKSFKDFQKAYEKIPAGDKVEFVASRSNKNQTIAFSKPKNEGKVMIRRKGN